MGLGAVASTLTMTAGFPVSVVTFSAFSVRRVGRLSFESRKAASAHAWASTVEAWTRLLPSLCLTAERASDVYLPHASSPTDALPLAATNSFPSFVWYPTMESSDLTVQAGGTSWRAARFVDRTVFQPVTSGLTMSGALVDGEPVGLGAAGPDVEADPVPAAGTPATGTVQP